MNDKATKKIEVTLLKHHTHEGKPCVKGEKILVTERQRNFLAERGKVAGVTKS